MCLVSLLINQRYSILCSLMVLLLLPQFSQAQMREQIVTGTVTCGGRACTAAEDVYVEWVAGTWQDGYQRGIVRVDPRGNYELRARTSWPRIEVRASAKGHLYSEPRLIQVGARVTHDVVLETSQDRVSIVLFGAPDKNFWDISVSRINDDEWVVGTMRFSNPNRIVPYGFVRRPAGGISYSPAESHLYSINNLATPNAVGEKNGSTFSFPDGGALEQVEGRANGINNNNVVAGKTYDRLADKFKASFYDPTARRWTSIPMPSPDKESVATGINSAGTIVGWYEEGPSRKVYSFIKPAGAATVRLEGENCKVAGVSPPGGNAYGHCADFYGYRWDRVPPYKRYKYDLPPNLADWLPGGWQRPKTYPIGMNIWQETIGYIDVVALKFAIQWERDGFITLPNRLVSDRHRQANRNLEFVAATSINDAGVIAGETGPIANGAPRGYILRLLPPGKKAPMGALRPAGGAEGASNTVITYTGQPVYFDASESNDPDGKIVSYQWSFGDGEIIEEGSLQQQHIYKEPGTYLAMVTVTDDEGYANTVTLKVQVRNSSGENTPPSAWAFLTPQRWPSSDVDTVWTEDWVALSGRYDDDGLPNDVIKAKWEVLDGPSDVEFSNVEDLNTQVRFKQAGKYVLQLVVDDGEYAVPSTPLVIEVTDRKPIN